MWKNPTVSFLQIEQTISSCMISTLAARQYAPGIFFPFRGILKQIYIGGRWGKRRELEWFLETAVNNRYRIKLSGSDYREAKRESGRHEEKSSSLYPFRSRLPLTFGISLLFSFPIDPPYDSTNIACIPVSTLIGKLKILSRLQNCLQSCLSSRVMGSLRQYARPQTLCLCYVEV